jgi:hypothetical protein
MITIKIMKSEFYIHHDKFQELSDKAIDYFIKSREFKMNSPEWQICRLKRQIYWKQAIKHLNATI